MKRPLGKAKPAPARKRRPARRADYGAPIDGFIQRQRPEFRVLLEGLRAVVDAAAPEAEASIKWGVPIYTVNGQVVCGLSAHKAHVSLGFFGPPSAFDDPQGLLYGETQQSRRLNLKPGDPIPKAAVRRWVKSVLALAKAK